MVVREFFINVKTKIPSNMISHINNKKIVKKQLEVRTKVYIDKRER